MSFTKEDFLKNVSQNENVYLLGFLWADGYIDKYYNTRIEITKPDFEYLHPLIEKYGFKNFSERQRFKNNKPFGNIQKQFNLSNKNTNAYLRELGYSKKSIISPRMVLNLIPKEKHYLWWRGYFDGDGSFYCNGALHSFTIWGSLNQDWSELYNLFDSLNIYSYFKLEYKRKNGKHCSSCVTIKVQSDIEKLGKYLYPNGIDIGFTRKYVKYLECISIPIPLYKKQKSEKRGVYFSIWTGKWICRKVINKRRIVIGSFDDYYKACKAYDDYQTN